MRPFRRELLVAVAALGVYAACHASVEPALPLRAALDSSDGGGGSDAEGQDAADGGDDERDAWEYDSGHDPVAPDASRKEPLPWWWGGGIDGGRPWLEADGSAPAVLAVVNVVEVVGSPSPSAIRAQLIGNHGRVVECYLNAVARDPKARGSLRARFIVGSDGRIVKAARGGGDLEDKRLVQCLLRVHEPLVFPTAGAPYTIVVSIDLSRAS